MIIRPKPESTLIVMAHPAESRGKIERITPNICYTGLGQIKAKTHLTHVLAERKNGMKYSWVINIGSAGSHIHPVFSLINPTCFYRWNIKATSAKNRSPHNPVLQTEWCVPNFIQTDLYTSDKAVCSFGNIPAIDMEGYALINACQIFRTSFLCIKFISDGADENVNADWFQSLKTGSALLADALQGIFSGKNMVRTRENTP